MPIKVSRVTGGYTAEISPPHGQAWATSSPMPHDKVRDRLIQLGCHSTDALDALREADKFWGRTHPGEGPEPFKRSALAHIPTKVTVAGIEFQPTGGPNSLLKPDSFRLKREANSYRLAFPDDSDEMWEVPPLISREQMQKELKRLRWDSDKIENALANADRASESAQSAN